MPEQINDTIYVQWLMKQFEKACRRETRWKPHRDQAHGDYEYRQAVLMKRCIREANVFEEQKKKYCAAVETVSNLLGQALGRNELSPIAYTQIMEILNGAKEVQV